MNADSSQIEYLLLFVFSLKKKENFKKNQQLLCTPLYVCVYYSTIAV